MTDAYFEGDHLHVHYEQPVEVVYQDNYELRKDPQNGMSVNRNFQNLANFPALVYARMVRDLGLGFSREQMKHWLAHDPEGELCLVERPKVVAGEGLQLIIK